MIKKVKRSKLPSVQPLLGDPRDVVAIVRRGFAVIGGVRLSIFDLD